MRPDTTIQARIDALTAEWCDLCAHYKSPETYVFPDVPRRMEQIRQALHGVGGLWEQRRAEIALAMAGGRAVCLGPTEGGRKRGQRRSV